MAKIHVGKARLTNRSLGEALTMSRPGDELLVHEGHHRLESFYLNGVHITGVGDRERIVIEATVHVVAESRISGVTLRSPHFHNLLSLKRAGARVDLTNVAVHGDPARKYPPIYAEGGTVVMDGCAVQSAPGDRGVVLTSHSYLHSVNSQVADLHLEGSRAVLADTRAHSINGSGGARVEGYGRLDVHPPEGRRWLVLSGESICTAQALHVANAPYEAYCEDSFLQLDTVRLPDEESLLVLTKGHAVVESASEAVTVRDADAPAPEPAPKVVPWRLEDARSILTSVAPHLTTGDTVQLEEGEYFLEDCDDGVLQVGGISLVGVGDPDRTVIHGSLVVKPETDLSLTNLTIRPTSDRNTVSCAEGRSLTMTNVVIEPAGGDYPSVYVGRGRTTMDGCVVSNSTDTRVGVLGVSEGAALVATGSSIGWLRLDDGSTADLTNCVSLQLSAAGGSTITSRGSHLVEANEGGMRQVVVEEDSVVRLESVTTDAVDFEAFAAGARIDIDWLQSPEEGAARVLLQEDARGQVVGSTVTVVDRDRHEADPATPAVAGRDDARPSSLPSGVTPTPPSAEGGTTPGVDTTGEDAADPLAEIEAMTGLATVKRQIRRFTRMVQYNQLRAREGKTTTPMVMHSLFLGSPGTGKTTVARLLGQALFRAGAIPTDTFVEVSGRADLVGDTIGSSAKLTHAVLERARGGVLFIDEAYTLYKSHANQFAEEAVDTILTFMENHRDEIVVVFAGYAEQMQDLLEMNPGLKSRVTNRFDFEDYTPAEVAEIGYRELLAGDHTVDEQLYRRLVATAYQRSAEGGNGRWARNVNQELVAILAERVVETAPDAVDISHISDEDLYALVGGGSEDSGDRVEELLGELDAMVGLAPVKEWVRRLVNRARVERRRMERDGTTSRPTYHMVFAGNPGTGKTTVARVVAELFHNLGVLQTPTVKETDRSRLVGQFVGDTERNTTRAVDEAMGGVLFVDEAYQLYVEDFPRDFGRQAIETLLPRLENDRDKFVAVFAGYSDEMGGFLAANSGLRSRVPLWIEFPDYSPKEVGQIVVARLSSTWDIDAEHVARAAAEAYAVAGDRSNGRWARNFAEDVEAEQHEFLATHDVGDDELDHVPAEVVDAVARRHGT